MCGEGARLSQLPFRTRWWTCTKMKDSSEGAKPILRTKCNAHVRLAYIYIDIPVSHTYIYIHTHTYTYTHTCLAHCILSRSAVCLHFAVCTRVVFHAFLAVVHFGIERAGGAIFAFCLICTVLGNKFLALSALCDCNQHNARCNRGEWCVGVRGVGGARLSQLPFRTCLPGHTKA